MKRREAGFTMIEVVLSMGLLMVGMSVILALMTFGAGLSRDAALRAESASCSRAIVADLEATLFPLDAEGLAGPPIDVVERSLDSYPDLVYSAKAVANPARPDAREYRVDVDVAWRSRGEQHSRRFSVLLLREQSFGARLRGLLVDSRELSQ